MASQKIIYLNGLVNLAQTRLGSKIVYKTDEILKNSNLLLLCLKKVYLISTVSGWMAGKLDEKEVGHDYLILKLGKTEE